MKISTHVGIIRAGILLRYLSSQLNWLKKNPKNPKKTTTTTKNISCLPKHEVSMQEVSMQEYNG